MGAEDWEINVLVRAALVRRWVDIRRIHISTTRGTVHLKGTISFRGAGTVEDQQPLYMVQVEKDIKAIKGVKGVRMDLLNWEKSRATGRWGKKRKRSA